MTDLRPTETWLPQVRAMQTSDLRFVARHHRESFPEGFFAKLGPRFLRGYYRSFLDSDAALALVICDRSTPVGYVAGATSARGHRRHVLREHRTRLMFLGIAALIVRPLLLVNFVRTRARRYWSKLIAVGRGPNSAGRTDRTSDLAHESDAGQHQRSAILSHIVVAEGFRNRGAGQALVDAFVSGAARAGCTEVLLVTESGSTASRFYERRRWSPVGERRVGDGRCLTTYAYPTLFPTPLPGRDETPGHQDDRPGIRGPFATPADLAEPKSWIDEGHADTGARTPTDSTPSPEEA